MKPDEYERGLAELRRLAKVTGERLDRSEARIRVLRDRLGNDNTTQTRAKLRANGTPADNASQAEVVSK